LCEQNTHDFTLSDWFDIYAAAEIITNHCTHLDPNLGTSWVKGQVFSTTLWNVYIHGDERDC